jgi:hypothetical protein
LETLLASLSRSGDFSQSAIDTVRTQAALIPAVIYAEWQRTGVARGTDALALVTETLTNFYLEPNRDTYNAILGIYARYRNTLVGGRGSLLANLATYSLDGTLTSLNPALQEKARTAVYTSLAPYLRVPNDPRYDVFSTPYE